MNDHRTKLLDYLDIFCLEFPGPTSIPAPGTSRFHWPRLGAARALWLLVPIVIVNAPQDKMGYYCERMRQTEGGPEQGIA
jgi:hypothetical protein